MSNFDLTFTNIISSIFVIGDFFIFLGALYSSQYDDQGYLLLSVIFGYLTSLLITLTFLGFIPMINGFHPPFWVIIIIWLFSSLPFIDRIEVFGNIIIDALFIGIFVAFVIIASASGFNELFSGNFDWWIIKSWLILGVALSIITIAVIRIYY